MIGKIIVSYVVEKLDDFNEMDISDLLKVDSIKKLIIKEMGAKRTASLDVGKVSGKVIVSNRSEVYTMELDKNDFADALSFAEDDAKNKKRLGGQKVVTLIDLKTKD